ncbi:hypothetical protein [Arthrobacter sp. StoSoilB13]|uniref:hypothetical protein n=1 Tax=Arthrobacter sp. StoSoilB13 TaxID=2830993 RepID=UPI001CC7D825|nr:hypothetical protein [Arthrobacter sp. StoSoilB13]BCW51061.1 hypothetical protein StoSoilB13_34030 [Arthrobacter sp. StoSoilB13]
MKHGTRAAKETAISTAGITVAILVTILLSSCAPAATPDQKHALVGTWASTVTKEDALRVVPDFKQEFLCDNTGTFSWEFKEDGKFAIDQKPLPDCPAPANAHVEDTWSTDGNRMTIAKGQPAQEIYEWAVEGKMLVLKHVSGDCVPCKAVNTANPWTRVG